MYIPASVMRTGLKEREMVKAVPWVLTMPTTVLLPSLFTTVPSGPTHSMVGESVMLATTFKIHSKVYPDPFRAPPVETALMTEVPQASGTVYVVNQEHL